MLRVYRRMSFYVVTLLVLWMVTMGVGVRSVVYADTAGSELKSVVSRVTGDEVVLELTLQGPISYRVWSTPSPSKIIIDLYGARYVGSQKRYGFDDVLVKQIRVAQFGSYTRVVMDLKHAVPEPQHEVKGTTLLVKVNKNYRQGYETVIAPGVRYGQFRQGMGAGQILVNYLKVDLRGSRVTVKPAAANFGKGGLQSVEAMAKDHGALAAVNANFFASDGSPLGLLIVDGEIISYPIFRRTAFGITSEGKVLIDQVDFVGHLETGGEITVPIDGVNRIRRQNEIIVYTEKFGSRTRTNDYGVELSVKDGVVFARHERGNTPIPPGGFVISAHGKGIEMLEGISVGDPIAVHWQMVPDWPGMGVQQAVGGGPRLLRDGQVSVTAEEERFQPDVAVGRAPRTAIGVTAADELLLVTVNGRRSDISIGLTLNELAELMRGLGAVDAVNLDGGGSATLVVRGRVLNLPSDGRERPVGSAILVLSD